MVQAKRQKQLLIRRDPMQVSWSKFQARENVSSVDLETAVPSLKNVEDSQAISKIQF